MTDQRCLLLKAAGSLGWPRVEVRVPGRTWPIPIDPSPEGWERFSRWFEQDPHALDATLHALVAWECSIRAELSAVGVPDG